MRDAPVEITRSGDERSIDQKELASQAMRQGTPNGGLSSPRGSGKKDSPLGLEVELGGQSVVLKRKYDVRFEALHLGQVNVAHQADRLQIVDERAGVQTGVAAKPDARPLELMRVELPRKAVNLGVVQPFRDGGLEIRVTHTRVVSRLELSDVPRVGAVQNWFRDAVRRAEDELLAGGCRLGHQRLGCGVDQATARITPAMPDHFGHEVQVVNNDEVRRHKRLTNRFEKRLFDGKRVAHGKPRQNLTATDVRPTLSAEQGLEDGGLPHSVRTPEHEHLAGCQPGEQFTGHSLLHRRQSKL
jgi:hypothetical protein